jgi:hypothetical protein
MKNAVAATRTWCLLGIIGWVIGGFGYWVYSMIFLVVINSYYPGTHGPNQFAAVWLRAAVVIAPVAVSCSWHRHARRNVYRIALRRTPHVVTTPKRVIAVSLPGILLGLLGLLGILALLSAAT